MNIYEAAVVAEVINKGRWIRRERSAATCCRRSQIWSDVHRHMKHGSQNRRKSNGKIYNETARRGGL